MLTEHTANPAFNTVSVCRTCSIHIPLSSIALQSTVGQRDDEKGSVISLGSLLKDQLIECQVRNRFPKPGVLLFKVLDRNCSLFEQKPAGRAESRSHKAEGSKPRKAQNTRKDKGDQSLGMNAAQRQD